MKKELSPLAIGGILVVVIGLAIGLGMTFMGGVTGTSKEDPALLQKQLEVERAKRPGGDPNAAQTTAPVPPPQGFSPGRESELEARQKGR